MPKKAPRNAFYFFMVDFRQQQQKNGITYANLVDVSTAADPAWRTAPLSVRQKFEEMAKNQKRKNNHPDRKYTSTGVPLDEVERQEREALEAEEAERQDIKNMIKLKAFNMENIMQENFYLIDVNCFCKTDTEYIIGESTVLRFTLRNGFRDFYHESIDPVGKLAMGYALAIKEGCQEHGLKMPDMDRSNANNKSGSNYVQILANIIDYLKQSNPDSKKLPPLFTISEKVAPVKDFIGQLCYLAKEYDYDIRIYNLEYLFYTLVNTVKMGVTDGFPKESLATFQIQKDNFLYTPGIACEHHESIDMTMECTSSRTRRWAYVVMDSCCPALGIELKPGLHVPVDYDVNKIIAYKEQKKERAAPTVAGYLEAASSTCDDSFRDCSNSSIVSEVPRKEKHINPPMRKPQANYSKDIRLAPELTEDNFPALSASAGRGRGLASGMKRLNITK